jgi:UDP-N-acetylglucosamine 2-epimerase
MKLMNIVGARPQFIKAAVISRAIDAHNQTHQSTKTQIEEIIVHTGQHYDVNMNAVFFEELKIPEPRIKLKIGSGSHGKMTGAMLEKIESVLTREMPECAIVYGDTNTTLAGALAAAKLHIPLVHVEAGLRSFNKKMPEEINRIVTDHVADFLFCPTHTAVKNLAKENIKQGVFLTGDVMYDSFLFYKGMLAKKAKILNKLGLANKQYALCTVHRAENADSTDHLKNIFQAFEKIASDHFKFVLPLHPRTKKSLERQNYTPALNKHFHLIPPISYLDMICLMINARVILTDSGGVQKEAYFANVPCITLRNETEWPETLSCGWNRLAGNAPEAIIDGFRDALSVADRSIKDTFGDGRSGAKTIEIIQDKLL